MKTVIVLSLFAVMFLATSPDLVDAKKKKKKKSKEEDPLKKDSKMFDSKTMQCLVCQYTIDEFEAAIYKVDPKKMIDTGTFRVDDKGSQKRSVIPFARSQIHLLELTEKICENFEDYAQAKNKATGKPTIIRLTTPDGNMNPDFGKVDIVPDDDLNTKLKFYCEGIVEDMDEHFLDLLADEKNTPTILKQRICVEEGSYCKANQLKDEL